MEVSTRRDLTTPCPPIGVSRPDAEHPTLRRMNVTIYTRSFCIWCIRAKWLLRTRGIAYEERDARGDDVRAMLLERTGRKTVPQVFFGDEHVGGFDDLHARLARA